MVVAINEIMIIISLKKKKENELKKVIHEKFKEIEPPKDTGANSVEHASGRIMIGFREIIEIHEKGLNCYHKMVLAKFQEGIDPLMFLTESYNLLIFETIRFIAMQFFICTL